ncbi:MAG: M42 family metallopeptidase [Anaerolineae bacterium]|jgi:endoglucanase
MILKELSEAFGPSGDERAVRAILRRALEEHVDRMWVDALGNLHTEKQGRGEQRMRVLVTAHMDEVGLMVIGHDDSGALKVRTIGGIDDRILPGAQVWVGSDQIPGVIGIKPVHLLEKGEGEKVTSVEKLVVDIGAKEKDEAKKLAPLGTSAVFATRFRELGPTVMGKAFDDRAGCAVLTELVRGERLTHDLHAVFTVQEEVGLRGARVAAYAAEPDCAFALEGTIADDLPKEKDVSPTTELGKGPAITVMDRSFIAHRGLNQLLVETAEELDIPYQFKQPGIGGTDSGAIHLAREGIPCATVSVPCRYIHGPIGILNLEDFEHTVRLMRETLGRLTRRILA